MAVTEINSHGVLQGDIKPQNIFIKECDLNKSRVCPIIGDWDLAYHYKDRDGLEEDALRYSVNYTPPEMEFYMIKVDHMLMSPYGYTYTGKEDVYALGIVLDKLTKALHIDKKGDYIAGMLIDSMKYPEVYLKGKEPEIYNPTTQEFFDMYHELEQLDNKESSFEMITSMLSSLTSPAAEALEKDPVNGKKIASILNFGGVYQDKDIFKIAVLMKIFSKSQMLELVSKTFSEDHVDLFEQFIEYFIVRNPDHAMTSLRFTAEQTLDTLQYYIRATTNPESPEFDQDLHINLDLVDNGIRFVPGDEQMARDYDKKTFSWEIPERSIILHHDVIAHSDKNLKDLIKETRGSQIRKTSDDCESYKQSPISFSCCCLLYYHHHSINSHINI